MIASVGLSGWLSCNLDSEILTKWTASNLAEISSQVECLHVP